jgi:hypothetical protein
MSSENAMVPYIGILEGESDEKKASYNLFAVNGLKMELTIPKDRSQEARSTLISTFENTKYRTPQLIAALFRNAKQLMADEATKSGSDVNYLFETRDPHLQEWAHGLGEELFRWEKPEPAIEQGIFVARAIIQPR